MPLEILSPSEQLARHLRGEILKGRWTETIPGTPALSEQLGVDRKMVKAAFSILKSEGLMQDQGVGKPRQVKLSEKDTRFLNLQVLIHESEDQQVFLINQILNRINRAGHYATLSRRTLVDMAMDVGRVARYVKNNPSDAWIVLGASREVLEWFSNRDQPAFALFGRRRRVAIPSVGPDKEQAVRAVVRRLVELGHRDIVYLAREERRKPTPGHIEQCYLDELGRCGIAVDASVNLPDWKDNSEGFQACLNDLYKCRQVSPTAIILDESQFYVTAHHYLSHAGLMVPDDVSLVCSDAQVIFDWCRPQVAHIRWDERAVVDRVLRWVKSVSLRRWAPRKALFTPAEFIEGGTIGPAPAGILTGFGEA